MAAALAQAAPLVAIDGEGPGRREFAQHVVGALGNTASTAWTYEQALRRFEKFCLRDPATLDTRDVRRFLRHSPLAPTSKHGALVALRAYVRFLLEEEAIDPSRAQRILNIRGPKKPKRIRAALRPDQVPVVLDCCRTPNEFRVIYLGLYQGMRISDSAQIRREHTGPDRFAFVSVKNGKLVEVPMHREVAKVMDFILQKSPSRDVLKHACAAVSTLSGFSFTSHTLRHTYSRTMDRLGIQEGVVEELLGHEQQSVYRRHYAPVMWEPMVEAQERLVYPGTRQVPAPRSQRRVWENPLVLTQQLALGTECVIRSLRGSIYRGIVRAVGADEVHLRSDDGATISIALSMVDAVEVPVAS